MNSTIQDNRTILKRSRKNHITSILAMVFMVASTPALSTPTFYGNFDSGSVTGVGDHNWRNIQAFAPGRINLLKDSRGIYARVEVRRGDHSSGCSTCTERSEVVMMQNAASNPIYENLNSGTQRYTFSVKFDPSWQTMVGNNNGAWGIFVQLHGPDNLGTNPAFELNATDRITFGMRTGDITQNRGGDYELSNGNLNKGQWIDFMLTVKYAKDNTGFVNIQRRDEGQVGYTRVLNLVNIPTLQYSPNVNGSAVSDHYMKHGLYRNQEAFTSVLYIDGFTRENAAVPITTAPVPATPLVLNPGFEQGSASWELWENTIVVGSQAASGLYALRTGPGVGGAGQTLAATPVVGGVYTLSASAKVSLAGNSGALFIDCLNASGNSLANKAITVSSTAYQTLSTSITVPTGTAKLMVWTWKGAGTGYLYLDNVQVIKK